MVVVHRTKGGAYILAEFEWAISRLRYTAFGYSLPGKVS